MVHEVDLGGEVDSLLYIQTGSPGQGFLFVGYVDLFFKSTGQQQQRGREPRAQDFDGCIKLWNTATSKEQVLTGHRVRCCCAHKKDLTQ